MTAIDIIDAEIGKLEAQIAGLRHARQLLDGTTFTVEVYAEPNPCAPPARSTEPPAKKPSPPVAPSRPEAGKKALGKAPAVAARHEANREKRRFEIARRILAEGPMSPGRIEAFANCSRPTLNVILDCPHFAKTDPTNRLSRWMLTESGRKLAESNGPG